LVFNFSAKFFNVISLSSGIAVIGQFNAVLCVFLHFLDTMRQRFLFSKRLNWRQGMQVFRPSANAQANSYRFTRS